MEKAWSAADGKQWMAIRMIVRRIARGAARLATPSFTAGSLVYIESLDGHVVFVKARLSKLWTLPGGFHRRGELPADTAIREVREEVGLDISVGLKEVGQCRQSHQPHYDHLFLVDIEKSHLACKLKSGHWSTRVEISDRQWRTISNIEDPTLRTNLTPEAAHALDQIKSIKGREV